MYMMSENGVKCQLKAEKPVLTFGHSSKSYFVLYDSSYGSCCDYANVIIQIPGSEENLAPFLSFCSVISIHRKTPILFGSAFLGQREYIKNLVPDAVFI